MHELSIAQNIIDIAIEQAKKNHAQTITQVEVDIGILAGVIPDTLKFVWKMAVKDTIAKNSRLKINIIPAEARCNQCKHEFSIKDYYNQCPSCKAYDFEISSGRQLYVKQIKVE